MATAIYSLRLARGQSLRQLSADVGISYEAIRRIEGGRTNVRPSTRVALERVFGLPFEVLIAPVNTNSAPKDAAAAVTAATARKPRVHDES